MLKSSQKPIQGGPTMYENGLEEVYALSRTMSAKADAGLLKGASIDELCKRALDGDRGAVRALQTRSAVGDDRQAARVALREINSGQRADD